MKITTSTKYTFELDEKKLDDMRLLQSIRSFQKGNTDAAFDILIRLTGGDTAFDELLTHIENNSEDGIAHSDALLMELTDILNALGDNGKNLRPRLLLK